MKPEDRIIAYLFAHKNSFQLSTVDSVVKDVKLMVFYGMSPISDEAIRKVVVSWATINAIGLLVRTPLVDVSGLPPATPQGDPPKNSDSALIDAAKKAVAAVGAGVTLGKQGANINIGVTGLTGNLKKGDNTATLGISWTGTLKLEAASGPFHFSGQLAADKWEIVLSFPQDTYIPDLSTLSTVFSEGVSAVGKIADATRGFNNLKDTSKIGALIKPHVAKVEDAVEAVSGIANADKKGGMSFGFKVGSPDPLPGQQGMPGGAQVSFVFTYLF